MKHVILGLGLFLGGTAMSQNKIEVQFTGKIGNQGVLLTSLLDAEGKELAKASLEAKGEPLNYVFGEFPSGTYIIRAFVDVNENGKLDTGMFGPTEPYGFSNNARGQFGPPSVEEQSFKVMGNTKQKIDMQ